MHGSLGFGMHSADGSSELQVRELFILYYSQAFFQMFSMWAIFQNCKNAKVLLTQVLPYKTFH